MANEKNLIPMSKRTDAEQKEIASRGGRRSGESRRKKKAFKEAASDMLRTVISDPELLKQIQRNGYQKDSITYQEAMIAGMIYKAICGNTYAYEVIKKTVEPPERDKSTEAVMERLDTILGGIDREAAQVCDTEEASESDDEAQ